MDPWEVGREPAEWMPFSLRLRLDQLYARCDGVDAVIRSGDRSLMADAEAERERLSVALVEWDHATDAAESAYYAGLIRGWARCAR